MSQEVAQKQSAHTLPHNLDAERGVLGSMLLSKEAQDGAFNALTSKDFYRPSHQVIFEAMDELESRGISLDHISVADKLTSDNKLSAAGGMDYLADLTLSVPTTSHYRQYLDIVKKLSTYRKLVFAGTEIASIARSSPEDVTDAVARCESRIFDVTETEVSSDFRHIGDDGPLEEANALLRELASAKGGIVGVPTGFPDLDRLTRGFRGGQFVVLGARPGVGKTALALNMAVGAAEKDITVGIFSLEMAAEDLAMRMLTTRAGISTQSLRGNVPQEWWGRFLDESDYLSKLKIFIDSTPDLNISRLRVKAKRLFQRVPKNKKLLIVDYLQLMSGDGENRTQEIARITRGLKILAKDLDVPILALSQLVRPPKGLKEPKRPLLSDLRESGTIEQDADIVMFLDRRENPEEDEFAADNAGGPEEATLILAKHRNGPTADIKLAFIADFAQFRSVSRESPYEEGY
ncbi:MAG: replicative DNA helicase [Coriobacteriia bacterium]|nr:replicative DNA helicase [Coriobacteriia bacterium]